MDPETMHIASATELRDSVDGLTGNHFSVYDGKGRLMVPPAAEDPLAAAVKDEYDLFVRRCIEKAILRRGASVFRGPLNQHQYFIPARAGGTWLVLVGNSFYSSMKDLESFFVSKGAGLGLSARELKRWGEKMVVADARRLVETCEHVSRLLGLFLGDSREKNLNGGQYMKARAIMDLFSDIESDISREKIYDLLCDTAIFLFEADTASIMAGNGVLFTPMFTVGRLGAQVESIRLKLSDPIVEETVKNRRPSVCGEATSLLRLGYRDEITSVHLFPVPLGQEATLLLGVFNAHLSKEDIDCILRLCTFAGFVLRNIEVREEYGRQRKDLATIGLTCANIAAFREPDSLWESILDISSRHIEAEKASLMLPREESQELVIKASKGMNRQIAKHIVVKFGEGIAGSVYKDGKPLMISDIETDLSVRKRPHFKTSSFVSLPLKIGDETLGVLNFADKLGGGVFSEADMTFLRPFTSCASFAIKAAHYYRMSEEMKKLSITDYLTGLFNRRYFDARFTEEVQRASRYESVLSLAIVDIDNFKMFNDTEGHLAGDEVLRAMASISRESLRSFDIMARFGGEEFSIIMPETDGMEAFQVAERMRTNIKGYMSAKWKYFPFREITVSAGIATFPVHGVDAGALIRCADRALYTAKVNGKDRVVVWGEHEGRGVRE